MASSKVVLCVGVFDLFHYGHLLHLTAARRSGDVLVVGVTRDAYVNKGPGRPVFDIFQREAILRALAIVDRVLQVDGSLDALRQVKPQIFAVGREYCGKLRPEDKAHCEAHGIDIVFTAEERFSSTKLLHHYARLEQS